MLTTITNAAEAEESEERMRAFWGPQAVDQHIRQAISTCWEMLPRERRTAAAVEREIRRIVDRALRDLNEDITAFGLGGPSESGRKAKGRKPG